MRSVAELILKEWNQFQQVRNEGGRASCQNHMKEFVMNRLAQFLTWDDAMRESYYEDLTEAESVGWNLLTEKYARMMRYTAPAQYAALCNRLPVISEPKERLVEKIVAIQLKWQEDYARRYPRVARGSRPTDHSADADYVTSFETYLRCELYTYSERTLRAYLSHAEELARRGGNMTIQNLEYMAKLYGFSSLQEMEEHSR
ncbi:DUF4125 family protein [bacterium 210917-DFI.7.65]|nr:DUF4125 family protein [Clostridiales bacterium]MCB6898930.1 DUF4125 family protein [bacterium 210917-DFI.7.65]